MSGRGIGLFAGFDLHDVSSIRLLAAGLDYVVSGGNDVDSVPALANLTEIQKSTIVDIPYRMHGSPLLNQILRTFLNTPRISKEVMLATGRDLRDYANYAAENPSIQDYQRAVAAWRDQVPMPLPYGLTPEEVEEIDQTAMRTQIRRLGGDDGAVPKGVGTVEDSGESSDDIPAPKKGKRIASKKSEDGVYPNARGTARSTPRKSRRISGRAAVKKTTPSTARGDVVDRNLPAPNIEPSIQWQGTEHLRDEQGRDGDDPRELQENATIDLTVSPDLSRTNDQAWLELEQENILVYMSMQLQRKNHVKWNRLANTYNSKQYNIPQAKGKQYLSEQRDALKTYTPVERMTPWRASGEIKMAAKGWNRYRRLLVDMEGYRLKNRVVETIERNDYESSGDDMEDAGPGLDGGEVEDLYSAN